MRGDDEVLALLNEQLTSELTAINQYFLHSKMQANWGFTKLAEHTRSESIDEMRHAEQVTDRILFLEGLPNYQKLLPLRIGQTVREQFDAADGDQRLMGNWRRQDYRCRRGQAPAVRGG